MTNIYVGNMSFDSADADLEQAFAAFGTVNQAKVIVDRATGRSRGFGFVEMPKDEEAQAAIEALNGSELGDRVITASVAKPRQDRNRGGGGGDRERRW